MLRQCICRSVLLDRTIATLAAPKIAALALAIAAVIAFGSGCTSPAGYLRAATGQYEVGNYNSAAYECEGARDDEPYMNDKGHVRYLVICGLASYRLGRHDEARAMLARGSDEYLRGRPNWLKPSIVDDLYKALDDLEGKPHARPNRDNFEEARR